MTKQGASDANKVKHVRRAETPEAKAMWDQVRQAASGCPPFEAERIMQAARAYADFMRAAPAAEEPAREEVERLVKMVGGSSPMTDPTPAQLREMAEWFDSPSRSPGFAVVAKCSPVTPGYLLRLIADGLEKAQLHAGRCEGMISVTTSYSKT